MTVAMVSLCIVIIIQQIMHGRERKDLYNRIMSRSLTEYKGSDKPPHTAVSAHREVLKRWKERR